MLALATVVAATQCRPRNVGPGSLRRGGTAGAACMLAAYEDKCRSAGYSLSSFGVDTARTETFRMVHCTIYVTDTARVIPQQPHVLRRLVCKRIRKTPAGDVVADRCTPRATISLTTLGD